MSTWEHMHTVACGIVAIAVLAYTAVLLRCWYG